MAYTYREIDDIIQKALETKSLVRLDALSNELFEPASSGATPFSPAVRMIPGCVSADSNQDESALALNVLNSISRANRLIKFRQQQERHPESPVIVSEGDSWFQYPVRLNDVIDVLIGLKKYAIFSVGAAGDTIANIVRSGEFLTAISDHKPACFIFSCGGNDMLGDGKLASILRPFTGNERAAELIDEDAFNLILDEVINDYRALLQAVAQRDPNLPVLGHSYDNPWNIKEGPWIFPPMQAKGIAEPLARQIIAILLKRFGSELDTLAGEFASFTHVNVSGVVGASNNSWFDALHPRNAGYERVAQKFERAIDTVLLQQTRATEAVSETQTMHMARPIRNAAQALEDFSANEAIIRHMRLPETYDIKDIESEFGPPSTWRRFSDPKVHEQIRDIIQMLRERDEPEDRERVRARLQTQPEFAQKLDVNVAEIEVTDDLVESIVQGNELEPIQMLLSMYRQAKAIGLVQIMSPHGTLIGRGTGFLVGPGLLLTNNHVLPDADVAARSFVVFDNEISLQGERLLPQRFRLTPQVYLTSVELDFTFASVEPSNRAGKQLSDYGYLPLIRQSGKALKRETVSIVQHPSGQPKMIAIRNSYIMGRADEGIYYTADTKGGSSGSPVFNREAQVVALHHRTVPHPRERGEFLANRGIRISSIFDTIFQLSHDGNTMAAIVLQLITPSKRIAASIASDEVFSSPQAYFGDESAYITHHESEADTGPITESDTGINYADVIETGAYQGLREEEFLEAIGLNHGVSDGSESMWELDDNDDILEIDDVFAGDNIESLSTEPQDVLRMIGTRGAKFIIGHEVSSRRHYERRLKNPILPGGASGVTIGIGYDLGHHSQAEFRKHWAGLLSDRDQRDLERCIGRTRSRAREVLSSVKHISISFDTALTVFKRSTLPKYFALLDRHIKDSVLLKLHPDCVAALVSLTFNRGPSYGRSGDRFREMRAIKRDLNNGRPERVPGHLRSMKRIWRGKPNLRGLLRRRDEEAQLFQDGLDQQDENNEFAAVEIHTHESASVGIHRSYDKASSGFENYSDTVTGYIDPEETEQIDDLTLIYSSPDGDEMSELDRFEELSPEEAARRKIGWGDVSWVNTFSNNPDYWHLPASASGQTFDLTGELIEQAIMLGHYEPRFSSDGKLIFAIRGARLVSSKDNVRASQSIRIAEQKPNHRHFRCVIASYDRDNGQISAFRGSTVPNRGGVAAQYNKANGYGGTNANMLPTGCYDLCVGTHHGQSMTVPNVLRLGTGPSVADALRVTTLRTINDGVYGTRDFWDNSVPKDNIHPAFRARSADFSSLGCLTLPGTFSNGRHRGQWALFRADANFDGPRDRGKHYNLLLTTGMECAAVAMAMNSGSSDDLAQLQRLSHGSKGKAVRQLQALINTGVDADFGPATKKTLTDFEYERLNGVNTGIYSMRSQKELNKKIF